MPKSEMKGSKGALVVDMDELERDYTEAMKVSTYTFQIFTRYIKILGLES